MAIRNITYSNKVALNENPSVADINKGRAVDWNEIKAVVNNNATETSTNTDDIANLQNGNVYSTDEIKTNKTWIDGKPIYRKVINIGYLPNKNAKLVNHNISDIDKITYQYAIASDSGGLTYSVPHVASPNMGNSMTMAMRSNKEWVQINCSSDMTSYTAYFILEYTKTTD